MVHNTTVLIDMDKNVIGASRPLTGSPMGLPTFFFFFSPRFPYAAENGISGGQIQ